MIILDTNVLSALMRRNADPRIISWLDSHPPASIWTTTLPTSRSASDSKSCRTAEDERPSNKPSPEPSKKTSTTASYPWTTPPRKPQPTSPLTNAKPVAL